MSLSRIGIYVLLRLQTLAVDIIRDDVRDASELARTPRTHDEPVLSLVLAIVRIAGKGVAEASRRTALCRSHCRRAIGRRGAVLVDGPVIRRVLREVHLQDVNVPGRVLDVAARAVAADAVPSVADVVALRPAFVVFLRHCQYSLLRAVAVRVLTSFTYLQRSLPLAAPPKILKPGVS